MEILIGLILAVVIAVAAYFTKYDRDRSFYPVVMIVIASYYVLFAVLDGRAEVLTIETLIMTAFSVLAILGSFRFRWLVFVAIALHGVFDIFHGMLITNTGVPLWWPAFCAAIDLSLPLAVLALHRRLPGPPASD